MTDFFPLRLISRDDFAPGVMRLRFVRDDGVALDYTPGQFIQIHFTLADGTPARRSYSLATRHDHPMHAGEAVEFVASVVPGGAATALFESLQIGQQLQATGPMGLFTLKADDTNTRHLLIATGTGIASYRSMLPQLQERLQHQPDFSICLLHGARTVDELLFADEFIAFAQHYGTRFRYLPCLSRQTLSNDHPLCQYAHPHHGYVQSQLPLLQPNPDTDIAYLCGNPNMVDACIEMLKAFELPMRHIRREKYVSLK